MVGSLFAAASFVALGSTSQAATLLTTYAETGDAGQTLATAQGTASTAAPAGTTLNTITGTFNGLNDADLFVIRIATPSAFSASTVNAATNLGGQDTALFLFNASGVAIATNDDAAGGASTDSSLPTGNTLYASLAAGTYFLGISESGNEPVNANSQLLFAGYPGGDTTAVRGAASGLNPTTLATFDSQSFGGGAGAYEIDLSGAATAANPNAVPEPSTWAALALGSLATLAITRRRRTASAFLFADKFTFLPNESTFHPYCGGAPSGLPSGRGCRRGFCAARRFPVRQDPSPGESCWRAGRSRQEPL